MTDLLDTEAKPWTFAFSADNLDKFLHIIEVADRRLDRGGAGVRFMDSLKLTREDRSITQPSGITVTVPYIVATMDKFRLSLGQYTFVARLVPEEAGMTVHCAPGESLEGWVRPAAGDQHCDHCNVKRNRVNLYVVRDDSTGELIQLGQQCIALYTGLEPKGLWALDFEAEIRSSMGEGSAIGNDYSVGIDQVLGLALALTNGGKAYVSRAKAEEWGKMSTGSDISRCIFNHLPTEEMCRKSEDARKERDRLLAAISEGAVLAADEALMSSVKAAADTLRAGDYADNLRIILAAESGTVSRRNIATLGSLVAVYYRNQEHEAERKAKPQAAAGFIGALGERIRDFTITVTVVREFETQFGWTTLIVGSTPDGHVVKWFASNAPDCQPGDVLHFTAATVHAEKGHEHYQGTDQTLITRGHKVTVAE